MTRNVVRRIFFTAAACAACDAHANVGIGLLALSVPTLVVALLPAILVEAPILARYLRVPFKRALWLSFAANVFSTLVGGIIAIASSFVIPFWTDTSREAVLASLVPMLFISWWLENIVVRRMQPPESKALSRRATGIANAISYAGMAVGVAILVTPLSQTFNRYRLGDALAEMSAARAQVAEHYKLHKSWPAPKAFVVTLPTVRTLNLEPAGKLVMVLSYPASVAADGKHIVYEPRVVDGDIVGWRCSSPDMKPQHLPPVCR
jgi:hypothetical protein